MAEYRSFLKIPSCSENTLDLSTNNEGTREKEECVNRELLTCKLFYFCYSSAMGSLWPYLPLYYRQLFLTPRQVGAIVASRNFVQFLFVPLWCAVAQKYKKYKTLLIIALIAWFLSTLAILFIPPEQPKACQQMTRFKNKDPALPRTSDSWFDFSALSEHKVFVVNRRRDEEDEQDEVSDDYYSPSTFNTSEDMAAIYAEYDPESHLPDSSRLFILLLLVTIFGVIFASPAQVLADICTLKRLRHEDQSFGQQALWAAVGSAMFTFLVGTCVSFYTKQNPCTKQNDINYTSCFYVFAGFILLALLAASRFQYSQYEDETVNLDETIASIWECVKTINDVHLASLLVVTFYCGFGNGFISTFLFWHLREMGGLQVLLAFVSLVNSTAEVLFYVMSERLMGYVGGFRLIYLGLFFFSARFFYYSALRQPWLVLPIEITHGITSAAIRSALISYIRQEGAAAYMLHGVFNGIHGGLGFSIGGLVGGLMVHEYGHSITFLIFGEISLLTLLSFVLVNNVWPHTKHELSKRTTLADFYHGGMKKDTSFNRHLSLHAICSEKVSQ